MFGICCKLHLNTIYLHILNFGEAHDQHAAHTRNISIYLCCVACIQTFCVCGGCVEQSRKYDGFICVVLYISVSFIWISEYQDNFDQGNGNCEPYKYWANIACIQKNFMGIYFRPIHKSKWFCIATNSMATLMLCDPVGINDHAYMTIPKHQLYAWIESEKVFFLLARSRSKINLAEMWWSISFKVLGTRWCLYRYYLLLGERIAWKWNIEK